MVNTLTYRCLQLSIHLKQTQLNESATEYLSTKMCAIFFYSSEKTFITILSPLSKKKKQQKKNKL